MRIFSGALATESNTFSPIPTSIEDYHSLLYVKAGMHSEEPSPFTSTPWVARDECRRNGWTFIGGLCAGAMPGGTTSRAAYETLRDELLDDIRGAGDVDVIALQLHGAMVADGYLDCEGDILKRVRQIAPRAVIGALLDPHCHTTEDMMRYANVLIMMKEYPHTDGIERSRELLGLCVRAAKGEIRPRFHYYRCNQIAMYHTTTEPMSGYVAAMKAAEDGENILSVSLGHGFPWGDVPDMGTHVLVVSNDDPRLGDEVARHFGEAIKALRDKACPKLLSLDECMAALKTIDARPIVLADSSDNPGGGAPSDSTYILRRLLEEGWSRVAVGMIWDPQAVGICNAIGTGGRIPLRVGGKACRLSGEPIDFEEVVVTGIIDDAFTDFGGAPWYVGRIAGIKAGNVGLVLQARRAQCSSPDVFGLVNLDLGDYDIVVVKSSQHFRSNYSRIAGEILYVGAPGVDNHDLRAREYRNVRRPIWPLDDG